MRWSWHRRITTHAACNTGWLNDCETAGSDTYFDAPDVASTGNMEGILVNMYGSSQFVIRCNAYALYGIGITPEGDYGRALPGGGTCWSMRIQDNVRLGVNVWDDDPNREWCPWSPAYTIVTP